MSETERRTIGDGQSRRRQSKSNMANTPDKVVLPADPPTQATSPLVVAVVSSSFFVFAILLYIRPYIAASDTPYQTLRDVYQHAGHFALKDSYVGQDFFDTWTWQTMDDPTNGQVNYVDQQTAISNNLSYAIGDKFFMRADDQNVVAPGARGRNSVRILSTNSYNDSVTVLDLQHMPEGCSTWPAFWSLSATGPWPAGGEIDILEGVNLNTGNLASLHTSPVCTMDQSRAMTGTTTSTNCDASVNFNQGCGVSFPYGSYGAPLNAQGGGWFVMMRTAQDGVSIWFWARNDTSVPGEVANPGSGLLGPSTIAPDPTWGSPAALFPMGSTCDYDNHFNDHQFTFDLTFCGDWAGNAYSTSGCSGSCTDLVNNNPEAFTNAYWEINALRVYTPVGSNP